MSGIPHTFIDELFGSPTSSPMPADARDFPPGLDYLETQLFSSGSDPLDNMPAYSSPNTGQPSDDTPTPGLGLTVEVVSAQVQGVNLQDLRLASPAVERAANPATTPLPMEILESRARMRIQLKLTPSFIKLAVGAVDSQPRCVDPAVLAADPQAAVQALPPRAETVAAGDASYAEEQEPGGDTEVEDVPDPLPTATLPIVALPPPDDEKTGAQGKRGRKRAAASGGQKRASKRRRSSSSKARTAAIEQESEADDDADDEDTPVTSSTGRPVRKAAQRGRRPAEHDTPHSSDNETGKSYTCTKCSKTFERIYDLDRHFDTTACGSADKLVCRVCGAAMTPRSDAVRRHLMTTEKCVEQQSALSPALREALGCPTPEQRSAYMMAQAARKKAKKCK